MVLKERLVTILLCLLLGGCLAGGDNDNTNVNTPLVSVNAGADKTVIESQSVTLSAAASDAEGSFSWRQVSGDVLSEFPATTQSVTFTAPSVKTETTLTFEVEYSSGTGIPAKDQISVIVTPLNQPPSALIVITSHTNRNVVAGDAVTLDASGSVDPDEDGVIVSYEWQQIAGAKNVITTSVLNEPQLSFLAPVEAQTAIYSFSVTVIDDEGAQSTNSINLNVLPNTTRISANAGQDKTVEEFDLVSLDASFSQAIDEFSCFWRQTEGEAVTIESTTECVTHFEAPNVDDSEKLTFELLVSDNDNRQATDSITITVRKLALGLINDSGVVTCYNGQTTIDCNEELGKKQDGAVGRDVYADKLDKVGAGTRAFDFIKLDENGKEVVETSSEYACVRDNVTGLIWEVKDPPTGTPPSTKLRAGNNTYTWQYGGDNGGVDGAQSDPQTTCPSTVNCGIENYLAEVNTTNYCGGANWRLATLDELRGLMDYSRLGQPHLLDGNFFRNMPQAGSLGHLYYWSDQTNVDGGANITAWVIDMATGHDTAINKSDKAYIRLVRTPAGEAP
ncbi:Lcl C-terminal domain-containing protein [Flocculibacter collagenilyticus]|uniref:Lcl C-terminal domain-containing protein n=1 Tax=Flocculibacter collagenilyticus TaxID=2744479 RepID=UPI0018F48924|nr:DUF1566 domain-containing protein [Flocculibacter collagenilyticus]